MWKSFYFLVLGICICWIQPVSAQLEPASLSNAKSNASSVYKIGERSWDGIGKYYYGREIAQVMGHQGAMWLERPEREVEEKSSVLWANLNIGPTDVIADIGAGTGYHTFALAKRVPQGKVLAVDIQQEMLDMMEERIKKNNISNVELILGSLRSPRLPANSVDLVLFVDVYHEMSNPYEMMQNIVRSLTDDGVVVLVEYKMEDPSVPIKKLHKMSKAQCEKEMKAVGLKLKEYKNNLPWQHFLVFEKMN
ncbi:MAG: class I SAM-dependent methyltransferase [Bacteroidota bacterium]